jgi:phenylacetate-CoA ligase
VDTYAELFRRVLYPAWETGVRRRPTLRLERWLEQTERRPIEEIEALQLGALRHLLAHAYANVPFYRARMDEAGLRPTDVRTLADLGRLPLLERREVRAAGDARRSTAPPLPTIAKNTSGSSGEPLAFAYDVGSEHWRQAIKLRGYGWAGLRPGMRTIQYWGVAARYPSAFHRAKVALDHAVRRERIVDCTSRGDADLARVAALLRSDPPDVMLCFSQAGADLARWVLAHGARDWPDFRVIAAAERLFPADREVMKRAFGPDVFETYGSREVMLMAAECEAHDGLHLSMENHLLELVVREGDRERPARLGETGEVVITDLHNYGMPFIRYATGDLAHLKSRERCACGRSLARLGAIEGRVTDTLLDGEGGRIGGLVFNVVFLPYSDRVRSFQVVQHRDRSITVRVAIDVLDETLERAVQAYMAPYLKGVPMTLVRVDDIPLAPSGKRRLVAIET